MTTSNTSYLAHLYQLFDAHFNLDELQDLCLGLNVTHESVPGTTKQSWLRGFLLAFGRNGRLSELVTLAERERPNIIWPSVPVDFQLPISLVYDEALLRMPILEISFDNDSKQLQITKQVAFDDIDSNDDNLHSDFAEKIIRLDMKLVNKGDKPANDVNIFLSIDKASQLYDEKNLRSVWEVQGLDIVEVLGKRKKRSLMTSLIEGVADDLRFHSFKELIAENREKPQSASSQKSGWSIQNKEVGFHIPKLQHGMTQLLPELYVEFYTWDELTSFDVDFQVNADEIIDTLRGKLHVNDMKR